MLPVLGASLHQVEDGVYLLLQQIGLHGEHGDEQLHPAMRVVDVARTLDFPQYGIGLLAAAAFLYQRQTLAVGLCHRHAVGYPLLIVLAVRLAELQQVIGILEQVKPYPVECIYQPASVSIGQIVPSLHARDGRHSLHHPFGLPLTVTSPCFGQPFFACKSAQDEACHCPLQSHVTEELVGCDAFYSRLALFLFQREQHPVARRPCHQTTYPLARHQQRFPIAP